MDHTVVGGMVINAEEVPLHVATEGSHGAGIILIPTLIDTIPDGPALRDGERIVINGFAHGVDVLQIVGGMDSGIGPEEVEMIARRGVE